MSERLDPNTGEPLPGSESRPHFVTGVSIVGAPPPDHPHPQFIEGRYTGPIQSGTGDGAIKPPQEHILQFFDKSVRYVGVPDAQPVLDWINETAHRIVEMLPRNPERTVALRKLLEAKESVVRAALAKG